MKKITQIGLIDGEIIANNCFSKFDWTLFYISKLVGTIVLGHWDNVLGRPSPSHFAGTLSHTITGDANGQFSSVSVLKLQFSAETELTAKLTDKTELQN